MLCRGTSDAATRLRRAKSSSSVQSYRTATSNLNSTDPETAHQHAVVAASRAYEDACGRGSPQKKALDAKDTSHGDDAGQRLGRRQSVRFTGPSAVPTKQRPITRRQAPETTTARPKLRTAASFDQGADVLIQGSDGFISALHPNEYVERRVSSTPSSYKKLRKTKSLFYPAKSSSLSFMTGSSKKRHQRQGQSLDPADTADPRPEPHTHNSSLQSQQPDPLDDRLLNPTDQDAAISLARDTYVRQLEQQRLKEKSSFMGFVKPRKSPKAFRRTVRTISTNSYGSAVGSAGEQPKETPTITAVGRRARSVSIVFKNRFKKVFQRPHENDGSVPKQQLNASRPYFGGYMFASNGVQQHYEHHIPSPDSDTLRRVDSRASTSRDASAFVEKPSNPASIRSVCSDASLTDETSRVSSWANSTTAGSLAANHAREQKRLSIIHENGGPYQPSSSMRSYGDLSRRYAAFNDPIRDYSAGSLFKKLKKEIEEKTRLDKENNKQSAKQQIADLTPRGSSYKARNLSTGTISEESAESHDPFSGRRTSKPTMFKSITKRDNNYSRVSGSNSKDINAGLQQSGSSEDEEITPKRPLREVKSTFFPPSTHIERRSTSPYRQAKAASSEEGTAIQDSRSPYTLSTSTAGYGQAGFLHVRSFSRSDSIYSRTTSGNTPAPSPSPSSHSDSESIRGAGTAVISDRVLKYEKPLSPSQQSRSSSAKSSGDWQRWMSSEVAKLETRTMKTSDSNEISPASTIGHKRESAQFHDDDVEVGRLQTPDGVLKQLLPAFPECSTPKSNMKSQDIEHLAERMPLAELGSSKVSPRKEQSSRASLSTELRGRASHASLTNTSSNVNLNKRYGMSLKPSKTGSSDTLRTTSSLGQLRDRSSEALSSHYSPEREARLRRMQSSNSIETRRQPENKPLKRTDNTPSAGIGLENARPNLVTISSTDGHSSGSQLMIERFLNNRRRDMKISEESSTDPAFI